MWTHREKSDNFIQHDFLIVNLIHCSMACARISAERSIKSKQKDCWSESSRTIHIVAKFVFWWPSFACSVYLATVVPWWNEGQGNTKTHLLRWRILFVLFQKPSTQLPLTNSAQMNPIILSSDSYCISFHGYLKLECPSTPQKACLMLCWPHTKATDETAKQQQKKNYNNNTHTFLTAGSALKGSLAP